MLPLSPRHTPVILMGAAILSDGITAASRCIPSVVMGAILEPGEKKKRFPNPPYIGLRPIYLKKKKTAWLLTTSQWEKRKQRKDRPHIQKAPTPALQRQAELDWWLLRLTQVDGLRSPCLSKVGKNL